MRIFIDLLLFMSVVLTVCPLHAKSEKIELFEGTISIIKSQDNKEFFLLTTIKNKNLYVLDVPTHFAGVARLTRDKEVTIKGVLIDRYPNKKPFAGIVKVKNIAPYIK